MLLDDAMGEALVELGAAIDRDGVSAGCTDRVNYIRAGKLHLMDFSKAFQLPARMTHECVKRFETRCSGV